MKMYILFINWLGMQFYSLANALDNHIIGRVVLSAYRRKTHDHVSLAITRHDYLSSISPNIGALVALARIGRTQKPNQFQKKVLLAIASRLRELAEKDGYKHGDQDEILDLLKSITES